MSSIQAPTRRVILIGAGHAHLALVRQAAAFHALNAELVLIDPGLFWYSGMATGLLSGAYAAADDQLDPQALCLHFKVTFYQQRVTHVASADQCVTLADGRVLGYDLCSLNTGSRIEIPAELSEIETTIECELDESSLALQTLPRLWPVKPIAALYALREKLEAAPPARIVVIGAGASGVEIAASVAALQRRIGHRVAVHLLARGTVLAPNLPAGASRALLRYLQRMGVEVSFGVRVTGRQAGAFQGQDAQAHAQCWPAEHGVIATGLLASDLVFSLGLEADFKAGLNVDRYLRASTDPCIFAVGDCAQFMPRPLPKVGVYGVRAAPILLHNLLASLSGGALMPYRPQRQYLSILNLGEGYGLAVWARLWLLGRFSYWLKDRIDRGFMQRLRAR